MIGVICNINDIRPELDIVGPSPYDYEDGLGYDFDDYMSDDPYYDEPDDHLDLIHGDIDDSEGEDEEVEPALPGFSGTSRLPHWFTVAEGDGVEEHRHIRRRIHVGSGRQPYRKGRTHVCNRDPIAIRRLRQAAQRARLELS